VDTEGRWTVAQETDWCGCETALYVGAEMRQGYVVRNRLLRPCYNATEVYFRSSDLNRTLLVLKVR